jgi:hypothetical protein
VLLFDDATHICLDLVLEDRVIKSIRERDEAIEPVRCALPGFGITSEPLAVSNVRPEFVQMAAYSISLDL